MSKVHNLKLIPRGLWGIKSSSKTLLLDFSTMLNKMAIPNVDPVTLGKNNHGRGSSFPPIFLSLKKSIRTFNFS